MFRFLHDRRSRHNNHLLVVYEKYKSAELGGRGPTSCLGGSTNQISLTD